MVHASSILDQFAIRPFWNDRRFSPLFGARRRWWIITSLGGWCLFCSDPHENRWILKYLRFDKFRAGHRRASEWLTDGSVARPEYQLLVFRFLSTVQFSCASFLHPLCFRIFTVEQHRQGLAKFPGKNGKHAAGRRAFLMRARRIRESRGSCSSGWICRSTTTAVGMRQTGGYGDPSILYDMRSTCKCSFFSTR